MARPKKDPADCSTEQVNISFTPRQKAELQAKAERAQTSVTAFVREASLGHKVTVLNSTTVDFATRDELRRIGVNLNQIAKAMNAQQTVPPSALVSACEKLDTLFDQWLNHGSQDRQSRPQL